MEANGTLCFIIENIQDGSRNQAQVKKAQATEIKILGLSMLKTV